jgi:hypothetical protein
MEILAINYFGFASLILFAPALASLVVVFWDFFDDFFFVGISVSVVSIGWVLLSCREIPWSDLILRARLGFFCFATSPACIQSQGLRVRRRASRLYGIGGWRSFFAFHFNKLGCCV